MIKIQALILLSLLITCSAQDNKLLDSLNYKFENFEYSAAISIAEEILGHADSISGNSLINIYLIKGTSNYILQNESGAKEDYTNLLKIDSLFVPDRNIFSPKIISFFNTVREEYLRNHKALKPVEKDAKNLSKTLYEENLILRQQVRLKDAVLKSVVFPGWGQYVKGDNFKGWLLASAGFISLCSSIYFIIDSNQKETKYLNEIDPDLIQSRFDSYNKSFRMRNISITLFSASWLYSLIDVLFISE